MCPKTYLLLKSFYQPEPVPEFVTERSKEKTQICKALCDVRHFEGNGSREAKKIRIGNIMVQNNRLVQTNIKLVIRYIITYEMRK